MKKIGGTLKNSGINMNPKLIRILIIIAAVLVVLLVILRFVIPMYIYNKAAKSITESMTNESMITEMKNSEIEAFNSNFENYKGEKDDLEVNSLISRLISNATIYREEKSKIPTVTVKAESIINDLTTIRGNYSFDGTDADTYIGNMSKIKNVVKPKNKYVIDFKYDSTTNLLNEVIIDDSIDSTQKENNVTNSNTINSNNTNNSINNNINNEINNDITNTTYNILSENTISNTTNNTEYNIEKSEREASENNEFFEDYHGEQDSSKVISLLSRLIVYANSYKEDKEKIPVVSVQTDQWIGDLKPEKGDNYMYNGPDFDFYIENLTNMKNCIQDDGHYYIMFDYDNDTGFINKIIIDEY